MKRFWLSLAAIAATCAFAVPCSLSAQVFDVSGASHMRAAYMADLDTVHAKITALANAIPEDKYTWRPTAGVRSISEVIMHVATEYYFWGPQSIGAAPAPEVANPKQSIPMLEKIASKKDVIDHLDKSWSYMKSKVNAADPTKLTGNYAPWNTTLDRASYEMSGDLHEHLGQLIAYARSVGVKPPWSK
jgi:uncharacterized damage-inducible protein DinB